MSPGRMTEKKIPVLPTNDLSFINDTSEKVWWMAAHLGDRRNSDF